MKTRKDQLMRLARHAVVAVLPDWCPGADGS